LLQALPDMLFRLSRDGEYLEFKPAAGLEPYVPASEFLGRNVRDILPADAVSLILPALALAADTGSTQVVEYQLELPEGPRDYEARIVSLGGDEVLAIVRDTSAWPSPARPRDADRYGLTQRELMVLRLAAAGKTDKQIGADLHISSATVQKHVAHILRKMDSASRTEACVRAVRENVLG